MSPQGNVYQKLISAAQEELGKTGVIPGSAKELSHLAGLSEQDVQDNFGSVQDLRDGLIYQGITMLNDRLREGLVESDPNDPIAQLNSMAVSYANWAYENTALLTLITHGMAQPMQEDSTLYRFNISMRDLLRRKLQHMQSLGILSQDADLNVLMVALHCMIKGANTMFIVGPGDRWFQDDSHDVRATVTSMFAQFLQWMVLANPGNAE
ncbi:TetR/AcrR family transcriptional regulator [Paracoccus sulfuroxidans]|uniref:AcrR family transcriptional regulator n=1 Tax=Paracoccus sulfuroxidans TaxID=384678 RepID=A0A562P2F2_9RHOB|nr:TetR/AcrR family transcriptional regulator [Paracoccus sulfuroxidans]TWI38166.1 AcrR family transcriptional regulator [Paracoccus sulfuroxidans]